MPESESKPGFFGKIGGIFGERSKPVEIEAPKSLDLQKKIAEKVSLTEKEICDLANDLVEKGVESSVARAKILSQTGQNTIAWRALRYYRKPVKTLSKNCLLTEKLFRKICKGLLAYQPPKKRSFAIG